MLNSNPYVDMEGPPQNGEVDPLLDKQDWNVVFVGADKCLKAQHGQQYDCGSTVIMYLKCGSKILIKLNFQTQMTVVGDWSGEMDSSSAYRAFAEKKLSTLMKMLHNMSPTLPWRTVWSE